MLATPRRPDPAAPGFTLLELVVVLAVLGLATALVAPQGFRMIASWRRATDVDTTLGAMVALGGRAQQEGRPLELSPGPVPAHLLPGLPHGWSVKLSEPLVIRANGACSATRGVVRSGSYSRKFALSAPFCRLELEEPGKSGQ
jgi:prepilin-type N-terminal cleavage/methylation domain-containing protein